ncbi:hypothetical protein Tsubulata_028598 [Turnera subulata]|uniref:Pentacotripeptide-repeat region of PRORP domain-containing protein n=1 Tax=Turnera subulata TaxID=218843 RepID=A0A9Q0J4Q8_9ROSI|nr:hypothetical protein Tsubulata_028598 [Turnera subulata]
MHFVAREMLSSLTFSRRIPRWVTSKSFLSSISCTSSIQVSPEINQTAPEATGFEAKIQFLKSNKLHPDNLIKVLNSTTDIDSAVEVFKWAGLQKRFHHTADTYYWMIFKLGMAGNVEEMEGFCQSMVREGCPGVEQVFVSLVDSFAIHCRLSEAIRVLANMGLAGCKPSIDIFNFVLGAVVKEKRGFQDVVFVYKEMVKAGVAPNIDTLNYLLEVLFETGRVDSALDQYRRLDKKGCSPNSRTFEIVMKGLIERNRVDDSVNVLHEMLKLECLTELSFYTCIIPLFCGVNKLEEGIRLFRMMKGANLVPDSFTYGALIRCLCKNLRLDDAVTLLEEMLESCSSPPDDVFLDVVNGFCSLGRIKEAVKLLENKLVLETAPYNALLGWYCNAGEFLQAKGLFEKMSQRNIADPDSWNILIRYLCEKADIRKAYVLLGRMIVSSLIPDSATHSALVVGHCRSSKYGDSLELFLRVCAKRWVLNSVSYSELVEALCKTGKYLDALEVFYYMSANQCSLQSFSFDLLIKGLCDTGLVKEAVKVQLLAFNCGTSSASASYNHILRGLSKLDTPKNLSVFLSRLLVQCCYLDAEAYCILTRSMIAQHNTKHCALFFNVMVNEGLLPDTETTCCLLSYVVNDSQLHLISTSINKLISDSQVLDSAAYNLLVNGLWKEGNKTEAHRLLDLMLERGWAPDAATHALLMGSVDGEETNDRMLTFENSTINDDVGDILAEGLGDSSMLA